MGKGALAPGAGWRGQAGQAPPGGSQSPRDQASRLELSVRRQRWREGRWSQRPRPVCLSGPVASEHHLRRAPPLPSPCSVGSQNNPRRSPNIRPSPRQITTLGAKGAQSAMTQWKADSRDGEERDSMKTKKTWHSVSEAALRLPSHVLLRFLWVLCS